MLVLLLYPHAWCEAWRQHTHSHAVLCFTAVLCIIWSILCIILLCTRMYGYLVSYPYVYCIHVGVLYLLLPYLYYHQVEFADSSKRRTVLPFYATAVQQCRNSGELDQGHLRRQTNDLPQRFARGLEQRQSWTPGWWFGTFAHLYKIKYDDIHASNGNTGIAETPRSFLQIQKSKNPTTARAAHWTELAIEGDTRVKYSNLRRRCVVQRITTAS